MCRYVWSRNHKNPREWGQAKATRGLSCQKKKKKEIPCTYFFFNVLWKCFKLTYFLRPYVRPVSETRSTNIAVVLSGGCKIQRRRMSGKFRCFRHSFWTAWPLMMGPIGCPEKSIWNYHSTLRKIPKERWSHLHRGGSLNSRLSCGFVLSRSAVFRLVRKIAKTTISFVMYARLSARKNSVPTRRIFMRFDIGLFSENLSRKFKFH